MTEGHLENSKETVLIEGKGEKNRKKEMKQKQKSRADRVLFVMSLLLLFLELAKQYGILMMEGRGQYNVWYFPFQLCSMPIYLGILNYRFPSPALRTFIRDFGFMGGVASLIVHRGLIHPGYPLLTLHGFVWHILLAGIAIYLTHAQACEESRGIFRKEAGIFFLAAFLAEGINVLLHPYGDCDMFYISPYHNSTQIVFCDLERITGRPLGILLYLLTVLFGAFLVHEGFRKILLTTKI